LTGPWRDSYNAGHSRRFTSVNQETPWQQKTGTTVSA